MRLYMAQNNLRWLMFQKSKFNFKRYLITLLSILMAVMLAFSVACDNTGGDDDPSNDGDNTTTDTTVTDYQLIKNGDFEFGSTDKTTYPLSSSINWSKSMGSDVTVAPSSKGSSGIIDTESSAFEKLSDKNKPEVNPKTPGAFGLITSEYDYEDEEKRVNPQVDGTKILMINNNLAPTGTAQYYKASSTVGVNAGSHAILSLWINTAQLSSVYTDTPGAYIKISSSVNSKSYDDFYLRGINTNGEWAKFSFAIKGSRIAKTTVGITVGLGEGNGTDQNGFVNGFVFVDNVFTKSITQKEYDEFNGEKIETDEYLTKVATLPSEYIDNETTAGQKFSFKNVKFDYDQEELNGALFTSDNIDYASAVSNYVYDTASNKIGANKDKAYVDANANLESGVIGENPNGFEKFIYMNFADHSSASYKSEEITLGKEEFVYVSFYAKVKANNVNADKLKVEVKDKNASDEQETILFESIETSSLENDETDNWIKYQAFINNPTDKSTTFELIFTFGFDKVFSDAHALQTGYAVIADLKYVTTNEDVYTLASASEFLVKKQIFGEYISYSKVTESETGNDVYGISVDKSQTFTIKEKPATNVPSYAFSSTIKDSSKLTYGIINTKYYDDDTHTYGNGVKFTNDLVGVKDLNDSGNEYAQVVVIDNKVEGFTKFVTTPYTVTAGTSTKVNVRVKAYGNAVANVSLVSTTANENKKFDVLNFKLNSDVMALTSKVTSSSYTKDGWTTVSFYLTAGNEDVEFKVQISNGDETQASVGTVLFDGVTYANVDSAKITADKNALKLNFSSLSGDEYDFLSLQHQREPSTVKEDGADGEVIENTLYYPLTEVYLGNGYVKFVDYSTLFADNVIDNTTPDTTPDSSVDEDTDGGFTVTPDLALQISSIVISVVLLGVMLTIIIRNALKKRAKRKEKTQAYYEELSGFDRNSREKTLKKIADKKAKITLASDDEEYDYEVAERIEEEIEESVEEVIEESSDEVAEQPSDETAEEVIEETSDENSEN